MRVRRLRECREDPFEKCESETNQNDEGISFEDVRRSAIRRPVKLLPTPDPRLDDVPVIESEYERNSPAQRLTAHTR